MKRSLSVILLLLITLSHTLAQDTIDTNYYRYVVDPMKNYWVINERNCNTMAVIPGHTISFCPNGAGFMDVWYSELPLAGENPIVNQSFYHLLPPTGYNYDTVYGLALTIDSVYDLTCYDSLKVYLYADDTSDGQIHKWCFDSLLVDIRTPGKLRWMRMPIVYDIEYLLIYFCQGDPEPTPLDNCIDSIVYSKLIEIYFDQPKQWPEGNIYWRVNDLNQTPHFCWRMGVIPSHYINGSTHGVSVLPEYSADTTGGSGAWGFVFPIVQPLPKWEAELGLDSAVVLRLNGAENIDFDPADCFPVDTTTSTPDTTTSRIPSVARSASTITLSPNPANDHLTIQSSLPISVVSVTDISGRLLKTTTPHSRTCTLSVATWPTGIYILRITDPSGTTIRKFSVKH